MTQGPGDRGQAGLVSHERLKTRSWEFCRGYIGGHHTALWGVAGRRPLCVREKDHGVNAWSSLAVSEGMNFRKISACWVLLGSEWPLAVTSTDGLWESHKQIPVQHPGSKPLLLKVWSEGQPQCHARERIRNVESLSPTCCGRMPSYQHCQVIWVSVQVRETPGRLSGWRTSYIGLLKVCILALAATWLPFFLDPSQELGPAAAQSLGGGAKPQENPLNVTELWRQSEFNWICVQRSITSGKMRTYILHTVKGFIKWVIFYKLQVCSLTCFWLRNWLLPNSAFPVAVVIPRVKKRKISLCFFPHIFLLGRRTAIVTFPSGQMDAGGKEQKALSCHLPVPLRLRQPRPRKCKWTWEVLWV